MALHSNFTFSANAQTAAVVTTTKTRNSHTVFSDVDVTAFGKESLYHYTHFKETKWRQKVSKTLWGVLSKSLLPTGDRDWDLFNFRPFQNTFTPVLLHLRFLEDVTSMLYAEHQWGCWNNEVCCWGVIYNIQMMETMSGLRSARVRHCCALRQRSWRTKIQYPVALFQKRSKIQRFGTKCLFMISAGCLFPAASIHGLLVSLKKICTHFSFC